MSKGKDNPASPVQVDIGAKLAVEVKAEVPTTSVGRLVDAITDLIRPWSEGRGLRADLIRMQREDVAFEITKRAARRIALENSPHPIPLKVLVPLLEKGSQEDPADEFMIDMWSHLLASSSKKGSISPHLVQILSEMNSRQAKILTFMFQKPLIKGQAFMTDLLTYDIDDVLKKRPPVAIQEILDVSAEHFRRRGVILRYFQLVSGRQIIASLRNPGFDFEEYSFCAEKDNAAMWEDVDYVVLRSIDLIEQENHYSRLRWAGKELTLRVGAWVLTNLGYAMLSAAVSRTADGEPIPISPNVPD
jgi:hypothetical protein